MSPERRSRGPRQGRDRPGPASSEPINPTPLPPELGEFLLSADLACVMQGTDQGTAFIIKAPGREIHSLRGRIPIHLQHELYDHPAAPVIRMLTTFHDRPQAPLHLESFVNVGDHDQLVDYANLSQQAELLLLFYDEKLRHRLSKRLPLTEPEAITHVLGQALTLWRAIPPWAFDFDAAKAAVMERTKL